MGKGRLVLSLLLVAAVAATTGALVTRHYLLRGRRPAGGADGYTVRAHCTNCGWEGKVRVAKGRSVDTVACPTCEKWNPERPEPPGVIDADLAQMRWEEERESSLITQDVWELRQAYAASGGRRR